MNKLSSFIIANRIICITLVPDSIPRQPMKSEFIRFIHMFYAYKSFKSCSLCDPETLLSASICFPVRTTSLLTGKNRPVTIFSTNRLIYDELNL